MPKIERLSIQCSNPDRDVNFIVETERLTKPLLIEAGILDFNKIFTLIPQALTDCCGAFPNIHGEKLHPLVSELKGEVIVVLRTNAYRPKGLNEEHNLYPLIEGGLIAEIAETGFFRRLFGISQLGLNRYYPLRNLHNRGEHSIYVTVNMARALQALYDQAPSFLMKRLREDFSKESFYQPEKSNEELVDLAVKLTVLTGMIHDLATPAGGDTVKYLLGINEEENLGWLFFGESPSFDQEREEFSAVLRKRRLDLKHLRYAIKCAKGESDSLIGDLINPKEKDELDFDRIGYTLLDCQVATMLDNEIPQLLLPQVLTEEANQLILRLFLSGVEALTEPYAACLSLPPHNFVPGRYEPPVPTNLIDCSEDYILNGQGKFVCTRPEKLAWIAAFRTWMVGLHYAGAQMLGLEWEFQQKLALLKNEPIVRSLFAREKILSLEDEGLFQQLKNLGDPELSSMIDRNQTTGMTSLFWGRLAESTEELKEPVFAHFPLKIKPGLGSLVQANGETTTLNDYVTQHPTAEASQILLEGLKKFKGKKVIIQKR